MHISYGGRCTTDRTSDTHCARCVVECHQETSKQEVPGRDEHINKGGFSSKVRKDKIIADDFILTLVRVTEADGVECARRLRVQRRPRRLVSVVDMFSQHDLPRPSALPPKTKRNLRITEPSRSRGCDPYILDFGERDCSSV